MDNRRRTEDFTEMLETPVHSPGPGPLSYFFQCLEDQFIRTEPRAHAYNYLCDLLAIPGQRAGRERHVGGGEDGRNRLLTTAQWDEDAVRDRVRDLVVENFGMRDSYLILAEDGFVKKGKTSAGVGRQYCESSGRVDNYQIGLFLLYADRTGNAAAIDRELLLSPCWSENPVGRRRAGIPGREQLYSRELSALAMVERALDRSVPASWVIADAPYYGDSGSFREALERRRMPYVLASNSAGPPVAKEDTRDGFVRWRLARGGGGSYLCYAPSWTGLSDLIPAASQGHVVRSHFVSARAEAGLARYSVRKWRAWYRHMTLAMFAHAVLRVTQPPARSPHSGTLCGHV
ncbi:transposase [Streptomyces sp. NPDC006645]|uniref:IS701 family transposase n=1 Tax=unclassified Streptomyces TaxID=2593676 RepID=UPI0033A633D7